MTAPVVLIAFNRPESTRRVLRAVSEAAPERLFLIADGPRPDHPGDAGSTAAVRRVLEAIDWPCEVQRRYGETNRGTVVTVELGLDWVFDQVEEAIVLEDDCLPNGDFFRFCTELLQRYRDTEQVWQISARAPSVPEDWFAGASYCFAALGAIWGWATWRRAWRAHRATFPRIHHGEPPPPVPQADMEQTHLLTGGGRRFFADIIRDSPGSTSSWDGYWSLSVVRARGLVAVPRANLIENIGYGTGATNTRVAIPQRGLEPLQWPLRHPSELAVNLDVQRFAERLLGAYMGRLPRLASRLLGQGGARRLARALVGRWRDRRLGQA
jgi:hypothetical protein